MQALDRVNPTPRLLERDAVELAAHPNDVWQRVRHGNLGDTRLTRALFGVRTLPQRLLGKEEAPLRLGIDEMVSTPDAPGFQILIDEPPRCVVVGAIGQVWKPNIPFVHVPDADAYAAFATPGYVKVAWALRVLPLGDRDARLEVEVRVDTTDEASWKKFRRYFHLIGPGSHFIRRSLLAELVRELGTPESQEDERPLPGDTLLEDAQAHITDGVTIAAPPEAIWPWLVQMGCDRAGFYSYDRLDNGGERSAREIHEEWQQLRVGQVLPATPADDGGFEVLAIDPNRTLILGGLFDRQSNRQLRFADQRPANYWQVTWAFHLEPLDANRTRLHVRARAAFGSDGHLHAAWIRPVHRLMQGAQLRHLAARAEGRQRRDDYRDVAEGLGGAAVMLAAAVTPFLRGARNRWGVDAATAERRYPGDELIAEPRWGWTHGIEIAAPAVEVWPWIAQMGADRGGFYSYQWLENLAGCELANAESIHPAWALGVGDDLILHPETPPLPIVDAERGRYFLAHGKPVEDAKAAGGPWVEVTWLFLLEPLDAERCRFISRYRCATSDDLATRLQYGPTLVEPIGFAMDRRMLLGIKQRAEHA